MLDRAGRRGWSKPSLSFGVGPAFGVFAVHSDIAMHAPRCRPGLDTRPLPGDFAVADRSASREGTVLLAVIPARYDSVRLPGKVLAEIAGVPMVVRVWERVAPVVDRCLVATDDDRVAAACAAWGAEVIRTGPCECGTDRVAEAVAALPLGEGDVVVNVQGDEPLIPGETVRRIAEAVLGGASIATGCCPLEGDPADPARVKLVVGARGDALYFSRQPIPTGGPWLLHVGVYAFRPHVLQTVCRLPVAPLERSERLEQLRWLEAGFSIRVIPVIAPHPAVDTPADLARVRGLWATLDSPLHPPLGLRSPA